MKEHPGKIFCQYIGIACQENFLPAKRETSFFLYPSSEEIISSTIEEAVKILAAKHTNKDYLTWVTLKSEGKVIFCEICKTIFSSSCLVCDITTLNFNLLFEIGYLLGLSKTFIPIFDTSFGQNKQLLGKIGLLDTIRYRDFINSTNLVDIVEDGPPNLPIARTSKVDTFKPIYYLKTPLDTEGSMRVTSSLKKGFFRFRTFDSKERARLPLQVAIQECDKSRAIVVHLLDPKRGEIALIHNARCAFVAGFAMASQKKVLILQEGRVEHPIDYRELIREYTNVSQINVVMNEFFKELADILQSPIAGVESTHLSVLETIDIGDIAAENEIESLRSYFVRTGQFTSARKGHAQLVIGRKGSGKTALFYSLRHQIGPERHGILVLDLKPEGYQFAKLHETISMKLSPAVRQHTLTAIWDYVLLLELAHKILNDKKEVNLSFEDPEKWNLWEAIKKEYALHRNIEEGDFSERLNALIENIKSRVPNELTITQDSLLNTTEITQIVFKQDIKKLRDLIVDYLKDKEEVWLLFDNLDKNWKINKQDDYEAVILRCLLDAGRKLQKMLTRDEVNYHNVIFIRNDIYSFFLDKTTDRGKDQIISLDWNDTDLFKEILRLRISEEIGSNKNPDEIWATIFDLHVNGESSFNYIINRTLLRPRDFLLFINHALQTAINRGHNRILEEDILQAEEAYSRDIFEGLLYEIRDIEPELENILYGFLESKRTLYKSELVALLKEAKVPPAQVESVIQTLLWFSFLGIFDSYMNERYSYTEGYDIKKLQKLSEWVEKENSEIIYVIHPGFSKVLETKN